VGHRRVQIGDGKGNVLDLVQHGRILVCVAD
jgi:hypothetical protein